MLLLTYLLLSHGCLIKGKIALFGCSLTIHIYIYRAFFFRLMYNRAFHLDMRIQYNGV